MEILIKPLKKLLKRSPTHFWLTISILVALYYGIVALIYAFGDPFRVQDDVRQHVVWMERFADPELFPDDWIADYYQTIAPIGFRTFFAAMAQSGLHPLVLAKILPLVLGLIATVYFFHIFLQIFPSSFGAFLSTLILNQQIWMDDDLISSTPRSFVYPIFSAFLYYFVRRSLLPCLVTIALQGIFFPQMVLIQVGILTLGLVRWNNGNLRFSSERKDYIFWSLGTGVAVLVLLPFALSLSKFGSPVTLEQMQIMPEFGLMGRNQYFGVPPLQFIFWGRGGLRIPLFPSLSLIGFALPWMMRSRFKALQQLNSNVRILATIMLASLFWFSLAHLLLPRLYLPSRYTYHSFRMVLPLSAAIVLTVLAQMAWQKLRPRLAGAVRLTRGDRIQLGVTAFVIATVTIVPLIPPLVLAFQGWNTGTTPAIYKFLAAQPKSIRVASLAEAADNVPAFALRSTLAGREFALAYHPFYYQEMQQRAIAMLQLQYSPELEDVERVIHEYNITWLWVENNAFQPEYLKQKDWLMNTSFQSDTVAAIQNLEQGKIPAILQTIDQCATVREQKAMLLDTNCIQRMVKSEATESET